MSINKPGIPKGTRDFGPEETVKRNHIFSVISNVFEKHGYVRIETPAIENLDTLLGKYGEEGDKLLFKILNSGDFLSSVEDISFQNRDSNAFSLRISEKGLRYDLTVPFARFVVQHQHEIVLPFKRYQIQQVWRADRPQKGRYREFYQCDADVIGSKSLLNETELIQIIDEVFQNLGIRVRIALNHRKVLSGFAEKAGYADRVIDITTALDKIEKIGRDAVAGELKEKGLSDHAITTLIEVMDISGSAEQRMESLTRFLAGSETGMAGIGELRILLDNIRSIHLNAEAVVDVTLARGLNYYTGTIIEVKALDMEMGSICGGGRYDDLTGIFGLRDVSGVGISFGADRIYDVMNRMDLFPPETTRSSVIMFVNFGEKEALHCLGLLQHLHQAGISAELYPDPARLKKQLSYADAKKIRWAGLVGEEEMMQSLITLKNLDTGEQQRLSLDALTKLLLDQDDKK